MADLRGFSQNVFMRIKITKGSDRDFIEAHRYDGSIVTANFPKKGWFPHDAVHFVVESELQYEAGFWGRVASGSHPEEIGALAAAGGHRSSSRAEKPSDGIVELVQAERIVECFEAEMWSEPSDLTTFRGVLDAACSHSKVRSPILSEQNIRNIREELSRLLIEWGELPVGKSLELAWF